MGYEIDFLPVGEGSGDAICLRYGSDDSGYVVHVVDGGYTDTGQAIVDHINEHFGAPSRIDHVVLSHADRDHAAGLLTVLRSFEIGALWMNRPWLYAEEILEAFHGNYAASGLAAEIRRKYPLIAELEDLANEYGIPILEAFAGEQIGQFTVLAPTRTRYLSLIPQFDRTPTSYAKPQKSVARSIFEMVKEAVRWIETWWDEKLEENPPSVSASNESSVVQLGEVDDRKILLTADAGPVALAEAADVAAHFGLLSPPNFVQVPHHGSRRNVTPSVLNRWLGDIASEGTDRGTAFCSVGTNKPDFPRKRVVNAFTRRGYGVFVTRGSWISHRFQLPRKGTPLTAEPFSYDYEE